MSRQSRVTATYRPSGDEVFQVSVTAADGYPDALDEARSQAVRAVTELMTAAQIVWPHEVSQEPAAEE